ncbi:MAG: hypothetical protein AB1679_01670 [Actinomycetota bacterium]|jgi:hypothetical protein
MTASGGLSAVPAVDPYEEAVAAGAQAVADHASGDAVALARAVLGAGVPVVEDAWRRVHLVPLERELRALYDLASRLNAALVDVISRLEYNAAPDAGGAAHRARVVALAPSRPEGQR